MAERSDDGTTLELPGDREILITRTFNAPARLVFDALTKAENVKRWWAPRSKGEMIACEIDLRVGGKYRYLMRSLDGQEVGFHGEYFEIEKPARVVCSEIFDPFPDSGAMVTVTLTESGGKTKMSNRSVYPSREVRDIVVATGMEEGMRESLRQLTEVVASLG